MEQAFAERIARAKEAARRASIAAMARGGTAPAPTPAPLPPASSPAFSALPLPPPDIQDRIDRLVEFIARNGPAFEATVREREATNPAFAFLHPANEHFRYFAWRKLHHEAPPPPQQQLPAMTPVPPRPPLVPLPSVPSPGITMETLSVGAMADAARFARASGLDPYAPVPPDVVAQSHARPGVEPGRLAIRLAEYYR